MIAAPSAPPAAGTTVPKIRSIERTEVDHLADLLSSFPSRNYYNERKLLRWRNAAVAPDCMSSQCAGN